jgi:4-hydroxyphenylpyruvate dioxygenase-like putative hemolysin
MQMAKTIAPTVGSQFVTAKSKVTGIVQEVVKNANGSMRIRLDVNGQDRWTTAK